MPLTDELKKELLAKSPEELVKRFEGLHEALDRHDAKAAAALAEADKERAAKAALEKKIKDEEEARSLAAKSEIEQERIKREKAEAEARELREAGKRERTENALRNAALALGADDVLAEDALKFIDLSSVEVDDSGKPKNAKAVLEALYEKKPHLKGSGTGWVGEGNHAGTGTGQRGSQTPKTIKRATFDNMTPLQKSEHFKAGGKVED